MTLHNKTRRAQRGSIQIEFVLSIMVIGLLVLGMIEFISIMYTYSTLADAAKEGVRYAIVHGSNNSDGSGPGSGDVTAEKVKARVSNFAGLSAHNMSGMTVTVNYPDGTNVAPARVVVQVRYPYIPYVHLPWTMPTINSTAEGRIAN